MLDLSQPVSSGLARSDTYRWIGTYQSQVDLDYIYLPAKNQPHLQTSSRHL